MTVGCCADLRYERRFTTCAICSELEVACTTSGSTAVPGAGVDALRGVSQGRWEAATHW